MTQIAADTSSFIAFFADEAREDVQLITTALHAEQLVLPPPVLSELLSDPKLPQFISDKLIALPQLEITAGFWQRVGTLRASVLAERKKARLADCLIAQACLDHDTPLITRDRDFRHFAERTNLRVLPKI